MCFAGALWSACPLEFIKARKSSVRLCSSFSNAGWTCEEKERIPSAPLGGACWKSCALTRHPDLQLRQIRRRTEGKVPKYTVVISVAVMVNGKLAKLAPRSLRRRFCRAVPAGWGAQSLVALTASPPADLHADFYKGHEYMGFVTEVVWGRRQLGDDQLLSWDQPGL